ncbi:sigma-54 interaction domain-containing protein [Vibrio viridaestus]|uniref:Sigma-54-dependent Fis family transcriptional regulator n=1 Tax=Vibrio viridaestus TaxID=2487322 RepID=A0A3N9TLC3_9VIBR|nr:sigma-54 dependent transcriptional regulator [Vibrio viridaestus]RQW65080.1 sigma-54-dependent Fis family transcriptional regulator [Vibrio viridaestus]
MNNWLACATDLVLVRKTNELMTLFVSIIQRELGLTTCELLVPSADGRTLISHDGQSGYSWSVTDFDCPFAHVLQSARSMTIPSDEVGFWRSNRFFNQYVESLGMFDSVRVEPLPIGKSAVQALLFVIGEQDRIYTAFENDEFLKFINVFTYQWTLLRDMQRDESYQRDLKESLSEEKKSRTQQQRLNQLSKTLIGTSQTMNRMREQILSAARSQLSVMVQGETGTGKELVAQAVHDFSERASQPFIAINCAAIPENLLESELFGYCKGAFSGADSDKQGLIAQANGGTLFLDEIGDMPLALQAKLLRVLETRMYRPVGGKDELTSDFRLVSATHVNLVNQVKAKEFRQDLYYRLFQYPIAVPKLAERLDDLPQLAAHFIAEFNQSHGKSVRGINFRAIDRLKEYGFPGNVRELKHLIEFGCAQTSDNSEVELSCLAHRLTIFDEPSLDNFESVESTVENACEFSVIHDLKQALNEFESRIIKERLTLFSGDRAKAAESLGIPKRTLAYKCQKLEI